MKITPMGGTSAYYLYLKLALDEAVDEYEETHTELQSYPSFAGEDTSFEVIRLQYRLEQKFATAILLTACCVEAIGNLLIAVKTTPRQFASLQRKSFIDKWTVIPARFLPGYTLPQDGELYGDLHRLKGHRNALAHLKEEVSQGWNTTVHRGSLPERTGDERVLLSRYRTLPLRLVKHVSKFDQSVWPTMVMEVLSINFSVLEAEGNY